MGPKSNHNNNVNITQSTTELFHSLFEKVVLENPHAIAIVDTSNQTNWTYDKINRKANALARRIITVTNWQEEYPVIILLENRAEIIISCLAALKAGAAFIPLSLTNSQDRLAHCITELGVSWPPIIISDNQSTVSQLSILNYKYVQFETEETFASTEEYDKNDNLSLPSNTSSSSLLAYIIFTSGSTGTPKGVMVEHYSLISKISWFIKTYNINSSDRGVLLLNPAFDASLLETWVILLAGGTLFILPESLKGDPYRFIEFTTTHSITRLVLPACFAEAIWKVEANPSASLRLPSSLKTAFVGGEQISQFPQNFFRSLTYEVINSYGPTEATVQSTAMNLSTEDYEGQLPPIGFPIAETKLQIRKIEEASYSEGELLIGGLGLARGYLNNPSLTDSRFITIQDPQTSDIERWYCTGDIVRHCPKTGAYYWLRRSDDQIKVNGYLIEPAEIERVITEKLGQKIRSTKVIVVGKTIVSFLVSNNFSQSQLNSTEIRSLISPHIAHYMLPSFFIPIDSVPTTPNGKVDKKQLEMEFQKYLAQFEPKPTLKKQTMPTVYNNQNDDTSSLVDKLEKSVASLWSHVLNIPSSVITASHDLFQLGGDSLQLTEIRALFKTQFGMNVSKNFLQNNRHLGVRKIAEMLANKLDSNNKLVSKLNISEQKPRAHLAPIGKTKDDRSISTDESLVYIFLHPEVGSLYCYNALLHNIREFKGDFYGFTDVNVISDNISSCLSEPFSSVKEMAKEYVSVLEKRFCSKTKFVLCGYQFGGNLAWEMNALLGNRVQKVFLFDTDSNLDIRDNKTEDSLVRSYEYNRSCNNKGVRVPDSVVWSGSHNYKLGLQHTNPSAIDNSEQRIVVCLSDRSKIKDTEDWWTSLVKDQSRLEFHMVDNTTKELILQEPHVKQVAKIMSD